MAPFSGGISLALAVGGIAGCIVSGATNIITTLVKDSKLKGIIEEIEKQSKLGVITESERYNKIIDLWTHVTDDVAEKLAV